MSILGENMNHCCTWCDDPQTIRVVNCCQEESLCVNGVSKDYQWTRFVIAPVCGWSNFVFTGVS